MSPSAATLTGARACQADIAGRWAWQWRELGSSSWSSGGATAFDCPPDQSPSAPGYQSGAKAPTALGYRLGSLKEDTSYQFRMLVDLWKPCTLSAPSTCSDVADPDSQRMAYVYRTFTTQPRCDDVQGTTEALSAFVASNPPGSPSNRRMLCLRAGTQNISQVNGIKAWTVLTPRGEADGTKQPATLLGNMMLANPGIVVEDFRLVGCYDDSFGPCSASRDKVLDIRANDTTVRNLDVSQRGGRNHDSLQCMQIASDSGQLSGVRILFTKSHSCGHESSGNHDHGLYCRDAIRPLIAGSWFYDNEGFGIQMYPNCDGADAIGNVVAENGAACNLSGDGSGSITNGSRYRNGFCGYSRESERSPTNGGEGNGFFRPIHCGPTSDNEAVDMILYDPSDSTAVTDCGGNDLARLRTLSSDPLFVNRAGYDFRMRSNSARAKLGIYAYTVPGPRW